MNSKVRHILAAAVLPLFAACAPADDAPQSPIEGEAARLDLAASSGVVDVVAQGLRFVAPERIPSGWVTFRFQNGSDMTHFGLLGRYPEGTGVADHQAEIAPVFQEGMHLLTVGDTDAAMAAFGGLPEWFGQIVFEGGPGLLAPGGTSQTTVYLEPGTYVLECYVKTLGIFHSYNPDPMVYGMVHEFTVMDEVSPLPEPTATIGVTISSERGIEVDGVPTAGLQTVAVHFEDQTVHENFLGHDVHLARLADDADLEALERWMDWSRVGGLEAPAPVAFLGGTGEMPAGATSYFTVTLEPGRYAWVAEVPNTRQKGMLVTFEVP